MVCYQRGGENVEQWVYRVLRYARRQLGMTQRQVAEKCGMSVRRYSMTERGQYEPDKETMRQICDVLHVTAR